MWYFVAIYMPRQTVNYFSFLCNSWTTRGSNDIHVLTATWNNRHGNWYNTQLPIRQIMHGRHYTHTAAACDLVGKICQISLCMHGLKHEIKFVIKKWWIGILIFFSCGFLSFYAQIADDFQRKLKRIQFSVWRPHYYIPPPLRVCFI